MIRVLDLLDHLAPQAARHFRRHVVFAGASYINNMAVTLFAVSFRSASSGRHSSQQCADIFLDFIRIFPINSSIRGFMSIGF